MTTDPTADLSLWAIGDKLTTIQCSRDTRREHRNVLAAVAEACWWIAALDEQLDFPRGREYAAARDAHPDGRVILGLRWAGHPHAPDLIEASPEHVRPFGEYERKGSSEVAPVVYRWRSVDSVGLIDPRGPGDQDGRDRYSSVVQGHEVVPILEAAFSWLASATAADWSTLKTG